MLYDIPNMSNGPVNSNPYVPPHVMFLSLKAPLLATLVFSLLTTSPDTFWNHFKICINLFKLPTCMFRKEVPSAYNVKVQILGLIFR